MGVYRVRVAGDWRLTARQKLSGSVCFCRCSWTVCKPAEGASLEPANPRRQSGRKAPRLRSRARWHRVW